MSNFSKTIRTSISLFVISLFPIYKYFLYSLWAFWISSSDTLFATFLEISYWVLLITLLPLSIYFLIQYNRQKPYKRRRDSIPMTLILLSVILFFTPVEENLANLNYRIFSKNRENVIAHIVKNKDTFEDKQSQSAVLSFKDFGYISAGNKVTLFAKGNGSYIVYFPNYKTKFRNYTYIYVPSEEDCFEYSHLKIIYYNDHWCYMSSEVKS